MSNILLIEKQYISKLHNLIIESGEIKSLPSNIQSSLKKLEKKINRQITDDDVRKELNQEKNWTRVVDLDNTEIAFNYVIHGK